MIPHRRLPISVIFNSLSNIVFMPTPRSIWIRWHQLFPGIAQMGHQLLDHHGIVVLVNFLEGLNCFVVVFLL